MFVSIIFIVLAIAIASWILCNYNSINVTPYFDPYGNHGGFEKNKKRWQDLMSYYKSDQQKLNQIIKYSSIYFKENDAENFLDKIIFVLRYSKNIILLSVLFYFPISYFINSQFIIETKFILISIAASFVVLYLYFAISKMNTVGYIKHYINYQNINEMEKNK